MLSVLLSCLGIIVVSFLCSLTEAAILSLPAVRARMLLEEKRLNSRDLMYVKDNIAAAVATIVVINNTINIAGSIYIGHEATRIFGDAYLGTISALLTFTIIVFGEVIPKAMGERFKVPVALLFAKPVRILLIVFRPLVWLINAVSWPWKHGEMTRVTEEEIKMMIKLGRDSGTVESDEEILINRVFKLNDLRALNIMKPLDQVYVLPADKTLEEVKEDIVMSPYNRIVVYQNNKNNIVGIVQHRILLREMAKDNNASKVSDWMLKPIFVNQMTKADALMEKFQAFHQHLFIVQDNLGKNVGLVTMEDIFEELFGEIYDEKDIRFKMMGKKP
jgi:CBS domain containing-hemolysin-like protein